MNHLILFFSLLLISCQNSPKPQQSLAGNYTVSIELQENLINKNAIRDSVMIALKKAKEDISTIHVETELDFSQIDTSTPEGKIEYAAKKFAVELTNIGKDVGGLGSVIAEIAGKAAEGGLDLADSIIKNFSFDIQLNEDGTISGNNVGIGKLNFNHSHWSQEGDSFYLSKNEGKDKEAFQIINQSLKGFTLVKEKVNLVFTKN